MFPYDSMLSGEIDGNKERNKKMMTLQEIVFIVMATVGLVFAAYMLIQAIKRRK